MDCNIKPDKPEDETINSCESSTTPTVSQHEPIYRADKIANPTNTVTLGVRRSIYAGFKAPRKYIPENIAEACNSNENDLKNEVNVKPSSESMTFAKDKMSQGIESGYKRINTGTPNINSSDLRRIGNDESIPYSMLTKGAERKSYVKQSPDCFGDKVVSNSLLGEDLSYSKYANYAPSIYNDRKDLPSSKAHHLRVFKPKVIRYDNSNSSSSVDRVARQVLAPSLLTPKLYHSSRAFDPFMQPTFKDYRKPEQPKFSRLYEKVSDLRGADSKSANEAVYQLSRNPFLFMRHWQADGYGVSPEAFKPVITKEACNDYNIQGGTESMSYSCSDVHSFLRNRCNEEQWRAVSAPAQGVSVVVAGPGSGKTRAIVHRIAYLLFVENIPPRQILAVTFTNRAAREMSTRLEHLHSEVSRFINKAADVVSSAPFRCPWVRTFHGFCRAFVSAHGEGIFPSYLVSADGDSNPIFVTPQKYVAPWESFDSQKCEGFEQIKYTTHEVKSILKVCLDEDTRRENLAQIFYKHKNDTSDSATTEVKISTSILDEREQDKVISECLTQVLYLSKNPNLLVSPLMDFETNAVQKSNEPDLFVSPHMFISKREGSSWDIVSEGSLILLQDLSSLTEKLRSIDSLESQVIFGDKFSSDEMLESKFGLPRATTWFRLKQKEILESNSKIPLPISLMAVLCPAANMATMQSCSSKVCGKIMHHDVLFRYPDQVERARKLVEGESSVSNLLNLEKNQDSQELDWLDNSQFDMEAQMSRSTADHNAGERGFTREELSVRRERSTARWLALSGSSMNRALMMRPVIEPACLFVPLHGVKKQSDSKSPDVCFESIKYSLETDSQLNECHMLPPLDSIIVETCSLPKQASAYKLHIDISKSHGLSPVDILSVSLLCVRIVAGIIALVDPNSISWADDRPKVSIQANSPIGKNFAIQEGLEASSENDERQSIIGVTKTALSNVIDFAEEQWLALVRTLLSQSNIGSKSPAHIIPSEQWGFLRRLIDMKKDGIRHFFESCEYNLYFIIMSAIIYSFYERKLCRLHALDFTDLLLKGLHLGAGYLPAKLWLRRRFRHMLVDEVQDSSVLQYLLLKAILPTARLRMDDNNKATKQLLKEDLGASNASWIKIEDWDDDIWKQVENCLDSEESHAHIQKGSKAISEPCSLFAVGDPNQSIYLWRFADPTSMESIFFEYEGAMEYSLRQNYRSSARIVAFSNQIVDLPSPGQSMIQSYRARALQSRNRILSNALGWTESKPGHQPWIIECLAPEQEAVSAWLLVKHLTTIGELRWRPKSLKNEHDESEGCESMEPYHHIYKQSDIAILYRSNTVGTLLRKVFHELNRPEADVNSLWGSENSAKSKESNDKSTFTSKPHTPSLHLTAMAYLDPSGAEILGKELSKSMAKHDQPVCPDLVPLEPALIALQKRHHYRTGKASSNVSEYLDAATNAVHPLPVKFGQALSTTTLAYKHVIEEALKDPSDDEQERNDGTQKLFDIIQRFEPHLLSNLTSVGMQTFNHLQNWSMNYIVVGGRKSSTAREMSALMSYILLAIGKNDLFAISSGLSLPNRGLGPGSIERFITFLRDSPLFHQTGNGKVLTLSYFERILWLLDKVYPDLQTLILRRSIIAFFRRKEKCTVKSVTVENEAEGPRQDNQQTSHEMGHQVEHDSGFSSAKDLMSDGVAIIVSESREGSSLNSNHSQYEESVSSPLIDTANSHFHVLNSGQDKLRRSTEKEEVVAKLGGLKANRNRDKQKRKDGAFGKKKNEIEEKGSLKTWLSPDKTNYEDLERSFDGDISTPNSQAPPLSKTTEDDEERQYPAEMQDEKSSSSLTSITLNCAPEFGSAVKISIKKAPLQTTLVPNEIIKTRQTQMSPTGQDKAQRAPKSRSSGSVQSNRAQLLRLGVSLELGEASPVQDQARKQVQRGKSNAEAQSSSSVSSSNEEHWVSNLVPFILKTASEKRAHLSSLSSRGFPKLAGAKWDAILQFTVTILRIRRFLFGYSINEDGLGSFIGHFDRIVESGEIGSILMSPTLANSHSNSSKPGILSNGKQSEMHQIQFSMPDSAKALEKRFVDNRRVELGSGLSGELISDNSCETKDLTESVKNANETFTVSPLTGATLSWDKAIRMDVQGTNREAVMSSIPQKNALLRVFGWHPYLNQHNDGNLVDWSDYAPLPSCIAVEYVLELTRFRQYLTNDAKVLSSRKKKKSSNSEEDTSTEGSNEDLDVKNSESVEADSSGQDTESTEGAEDNTMENIEQFKRQSIYHDLNFAHKLLTEDVQKPCFQKKSNDKENFLSFEEHEQMDAEKFMKLLSSLDVDFERLRECLPSLEVATIDRLRKEWSNELLASSPKLPDLSSLESLSSVLTFPSQKKSDNPIEVSKLCQSYIDEFLHKNRTNLVNIRRNSLYESRILGLDTSYESVSPSVTSEELLSYVSKVSIRRSATCTMLGSFSAQKVVDSYFVKHRRKIKSFHEDEDLPSPSIEDFDDFDLTDYTLTTNRISAIASFIEESKLDPSLSLQESTVNNTEVSQVEDQPNIKLEELEPQSIVEGRSRTAKKENPKDTQSQESRVTISTIHGAKGLEWPVVIVVCAEDGRLPRSDVARVTDTLCPPGEDPQSLSLLQKTKIENASGDLQMKIKMEDSGIDFYAKAAIEQSTRPTRIVPTCFDELDEERRLLYVASTRARDRLFITFSLTREKTVPLDCFGLAKALPDRRAVCNSQEDMVDLNIDEDCDHMTTRESNSEMNAAQYPASSNPMRSSSNLPDNQLTSLAEYSFNARKALIRSSQLQAKVPTISSIVFSTQLSEYGARMSRFLHGVTKRTLFQLKPPEQESMNELPDEDDVHLLSLAMPLLYFSRTNAYTKPRFQLNNKK